MNYYKVLNKQSYHLGDYSIVPIRDEDKWDIMKWRNEQIYHLRQSKYLLAEDQEQYFANVVSKLFNQSEPCQILFSYLYKGKCIGYGGLVHINWIDKNAEISFIMNTLLEKDEFAKHWSIFLYLAERVAFMELFLHKIFTYAFDLRPHLYNVLESNNYVKEATLSDHCFFDGHYKDVVIHSKFKNRFHLRTIERADKKIVFEWSNEEQTRKNSFNSDPILFEEHALWFDKKLTSSQAIYLICEYEGSPAGLIRFDMNDSYTTIGIIISANFRGKGLAMPFIVEACKLFRIISYNKSIRAFIKPENLASKRSFEKSGFEYKGNQIINNIDALVYEYNK